MLTLNPYLVYNGACETAFNFYQTVFRCEAPYIGYYRDAPAEAKSVFANAADHQVMHATLKINEQVTLMGNDAPNPTEHELSSAIDFYLYIDFVEADEAFRVFNELSDGGKIIVPVSKTFWSPCYGVLIDRFGISWKITWH